MVPLPGGSLGIRIAAASVRKELRTGGDRSHQGQGTEIAQNILRLLKPTDMTIHWKALEMHILMVPFVFQFTNLRGENAFS
jgi:hypothetical protein